MFKFKSNYNLKQTILVLAYCIFSTAYSFCFSQTTEKDFTFLHNNSPVSSVEILSEYIQKASLSGSEKEAGAYIKGICKENGLHIFQMGEENGNYNFAASVRPLSENLPNIVFLNHIDVVPPGNLQEWEYPPFSGEIIENEVWGRGAFDNKGAAMMQLASVIEILRKYKNKEIPYNVTFLAVSCEETQCEGGVKYVVKNYLKELNPAIVIGEGPTEFKGLLDLNDKEDVFGISVAHKRAFWLQLDLEIDTQGHGSVTPLKYANKEMVMALAQLSKKKQKAIFNDLNVGLLKQLGAIKTGIPSFILKHPRLFKPLIVPKLRKKPELFALFSNTMTITSIDSDNNTVNVVPTKATALLDCRLLPSTSSDDFLATIKKRLNNDAIKIKVINEMPEMPAIEEATFFYDCLAAVILKQYPKSHVLKVMMPNFNDVGVFRVEGVPAISSIPVEIDVAYLKNIHKNNERIPTHILKQGQTVYTAFIEKCFEK